MMIKIRKNLFFLLFLLFLSSFFVANSAGVEEKNKEELKSNNKMLENDKIEDNQNERNRLTVVEEEEKEEKIETISGISDDIDLDSLLLMELKDGIVVIELFSEVAPWHVYRIKLLTGEGFYDKLTFHRVLDNFMAQTGDPKGDGTGGSKFGPLQAEISKLKHQRGTVSMARANDMDSANSQFFIVLSDKNIEHLDDQYTIFGKVIQGMDIVNKIKKGDINNNGLVKDPDIILKMKLGQEMNYNYESDTEEDKKQRKKERVEILRNLKDFKKMNDQMNTNSEKNSLLLDKIFELNSEL